MSKKLSNRLRDREKRATSEDGNTSKVPLLGSGFHRTSSGVRSATNKVLQRSKSPEIEEVPVPFEKLGQALKNYFLDLRNKKEDGPIFRYHRLQHLGIKIADDDALEHGWSQKMLDLLRGLPQLQDVMGQDHSFSPPPEVIVHELLRRKITPEEASVFSIILTPPQLLRYSPDEKTLEQLVRLGIISNTLFDSYRQQEIEKESSGPGLDTPPPSKSDIHDIVEGVHYNTYNAAQIDGNSSKLPPALQRLKERRDRKKSKS